MMSFFKFTKAKEKLSNDHFFFNFKKVKKPSLVCPFNFTKQKYFSICKRWFVFSNISHLLFFKLIYINKFDLVEEMLFSELWFQLLFFFFLRTKSYTTGREPVITRTTEKSKNGRKSKSHVSFLNEIASSVRHCDMI